MEEGGTLARGQRPPPSVHGGRQRLRWRAVGTAAEQRLPQLPAVQGLLPLRRPGAAAAATTGDTGNDMLEIDFGKLDTAATDERNTQNYLEKHPQMDTIKPRGAGRCREEEAADSRPRH